MCENIKVSSFASLTVFILASNETDLLSQTVERICSSCNANDIERIVIVLASADCASAAQAEHIATERKDVRIDIYVQRSKSAELCLAELPPLAESTHFVIMAADMEMNPDDVAEFIVQAKLHPKRIICASKWRRDSTVVNYGFFHRLGSICLNRFAALILQSDAKDLFSIFQIYPTALYYEAGFEKPSNFGYEYTLKPLRLGAEYTEIKTTYVKRSQGESNFGVFKLVRVALKFWAVALRLRFTPKSLLKRK